MIKKHIVRTSLFILIGVFLIYGLGFGLKKLAIFYNFNERKVEQITQMKNQEFELLMMGNSLTNQGVISTIIDSICDVSSYNMAIGGARFITMEMLLLEYLENNNPPKFITYNIFVNGSSSDLPKTQRPSVLSNVSEPVLNYYRMLREKTDVSLELYNRLELFRHRQSLRYVGDFVNGKERTEMIHGYTKKLKSFKSPLQFPDHDADLDTAGLNRFHRLCVKNGIQLILFEPPGQVSYSYGEAKAIFDGTSSQNSSQWRNIQTVNGKNSDLPVSRSDFSAGHRISSNMSYEHKWSDNVKTTIGLFYNGSQGTPYSYTYREGRDILNDDSRDNALMYVPANAGEIVLEDRTGSTAGTGDEWAILNAYIEADDYLSTRRGQYAERNGSRGPWSHIIDLKFLQDFSFDALSKKNTFQVSLDIFNFTNLLNKDWGQQRFAFRNTQILETESASGGSTPVFSLNESVLEDGPDQLDDIGIQSSRWQMQVGLRYIFN